MTDEPNVEALKANLRDRLAERLEDDVRRLLDEADPNPLDDQDATDIVYWASQIVSYNLRESQNESLQ